MGGEQSAQRNSFMSTEAIHTLSSGESHTSESLKIVRLQHPGSCSGAVARSHDQYLLDKTFTLTLLIYLAFLGMFWRGDPTTGKSAPSNSNWPRNGSLLKGTGPHLVGGTAYFKVVEFQQSGSNGFEPVPEGTWMLYDQGGKLLHDV